VRVAYRALLAVAVTFALAACVSMGTNYDPNRVSALHAGMMESEVVALLGRPNAIATNANGQRVLVWLHSTGSMFGASARSLSLVFGPDDRLLEAPSISTQVSY
jgi:hypothetical protein